MNPSTGEGGPTVESGDAGADARSPSAPPAPPPPIDGVPVKGIFVSASKGSDDAEATAVRPVKTLARAIELAKLRIATGQENLPVIACAEVYNESITLGDGVALYGYYDCSATPWKQTAKLAGIVAPSPLAPAILADGLSAEATRVAGFSVFAKDWPGLPQGRNSAASSFGMIVHKAKGLVLEDMEIHGAAGQDGLDGLEPAAVNGFVDVKAANGVGGGGGAGGCGGYAGEGGRGGGASVGLLVLDSQIRLARTKVVAGKGGAGGHGAAGAPGALGGAGGPRSFTEPLETGDSGSRGGSGGAGGQSGHGAPGPSIALAWHGTRPTLDADVPLLPGSAGAAPGAVTDGNQTLPAPEQIAKAEHAF